MSKSEASSSSTILQIIIRTCQKIKREKIKKRDKNKKSHFTGEIS
jgi:hypothetical protein